MTKKPAHTLSPPIIPLMGKTMKHIEAMLVSNMRAHGIDLTKNQVILMKWISEGPRPQSSLALITERDKGCLTRLIQSMEKKKLVERVISQEDKREKWVKLTKTGEAAIGEAFPVFEVAFELLLDGISAKDRRTALKVLNKILENAAEEIKCKCT
jgi:DNA-binding MarR family transcriptional regulator